MKKLETLGRKLSKEEQKKVLGGSGESADICTSSCWINVTEFLGSVPTSDCSVNNADKCKDIYPTATKASCSCD